MAALSDLLSWADNKRRVIGRNISDLVQNPRDAIPMIAERAGETLIDHFKDPMNFIGGGVGHIAYHGSPHKFDKFRSEAIGTGEGAQAYGHGLYLAESPEVAREYQKNLSQFSRIDGKPIVGNKNISAGARTYLLAENADLPKAIQNAKDAIALKPNNELLPPILAELESLRPESITKSSAGNLYKTDIPDEAVARMLDWDKPLSQQAPEVQAALEKAGVYDSAKVAKLRNELNSLTENKQFDYADLIESRLNKLDPIAGNLVRNFELPKSGKGSAKNSSEWFSQQGIPGIRYLDGGSRSAGQGSSNFVAFDPEMIRILERNGQPTGLQPWKPGEYRPVSDLMNVRTD